MSHVTNLILTTSLGDDEPPMAAALAALGLTRVDDHVDASASSRNKCVERCVWLAAFNHMDIDAFAARLRAIAWKRPESVQLFVADQGEERFAEYPLAIPGEDD